jgi:hypothetical protein
MGAQRANTMNFRWLGEALIGIIIAFVLMKGTDWMEFFGKTKTTFIKWRQEKYQSSSFNMDTKNQFIKFEYDDYECKENEYLLEQYDE